MIKENQKLLNQIQVVLDGIVIILAYALSWYIRFRSGIFELDEWYLSLQEYMKWLWGIVPGFLMLYYIFKLYVPKRVLGRRLEAWRILQANIIGVMALIVVLYVIKQPNISRTMLFVFGVVDVFGEVLERNLVRIILRKIRKNGYNLKHIILVGYSNAAEEYIDRIKANPEWGYQIRGILDDSIEIGSEYKGIVEGGVGYDFFEEQLALSVSTSHGVIFNDSFFIGANVGFFHSRVSNNNRYDLYYVPTLALDSRYYFHLQTIGLQPYIGAQAGVGFSKNDYWYRSDYSDNSGSYTEFALNATLMAGLRIRLNDSLGITTGIRSIYTFDNLGVLFQVGLEF